MAKFSFNKRSAVFLLAGILMSVIVFGSAIYILWRLSFDLKEVFQSASPGSAKIVKFEIDKAKAILGM